MGQEDANGGAAPQNGGARTAPSPWQVAALTRVMEVATFVLMAVWVFNYLGGLAFTPRVSPFTDVSCKGPWATRILKMRIIGYYVGDRWVVVGCFRFWRERLWE
jgi:hypothetical protein